MGQARPFGSWGVPHGRFAHAPGSHETKHCIARVATTSSTSPCLGFRFFAGAVVLAVLQLQQGAAVTCAVYPAWLARASKQAGASPCRCSTAHACAMRADQWLMQHLRVFCMHAEASARVKDAAEHVHGQRRGFGLDPAGTWEVATCCNWTAHGPILDSDRTEARSTPTAGALLRVCSQQLAVGPDSPWHQLPGKHHAAQAYAPTAAAVPISRPAAARYACGPTSVRGSSRYGLLAVTDRSIPHNAPPHRHPNAQPCTAAAAMEQGGRAAGVVAAGRGAAC